VPQIRGRGVRALFVGGRADGRALYVEHLQPVVVVYADERGALRVQQEHGHAGARYQLVEPVGPEMPVYVHA
jgi:hypothetical protein